MLRNANADLRFSRITRRNSRNLAILFQNLNREFAFVLTTSVPCIARTFNPPLRCLLDREFVLLEGHTTVLISELFSKQSRNRCLLFKYLVNLVKFELSDEIYTGVSTQAPRFSGRCKTQIYILKPSATANRRVVGGWDIRL